jgi:hypothetical protein
LAIAERCQSKVSLGVKNSLKSYFFPFSIIQRYLSLPDLRSCRIALWMQMSGVFYIIGISCYMGLLIHAYYFDCDPLTTGVGRAIRFSSYTNS